MSSSSSEQIASRGLVFAVGAYGIWGLCLPLYMKALSHVSPLEIVGHRVIWAIPCGLLLLWWQGALPALGRHLRDPRTVALASLTAALISLNWGVYVYAITSGQALAAALGYYINPLVNVLLGAVFLAERPDRTQSVAIALAAVGVAIMTARAGSLPWISLLLAGSFGTYGLLRKVVPVGATEGFTLEVLILAGPALVLLALLPEGGPFHHTSLDMALLVGAGPLTATPLILYAAGARLLNYATIGILQYIVPTLIFLTAVFLFGEPFGLWQLVAFGFIWSALVVYSWSLLGSARARRQARARPAQ